jgi:hypothetical protein
MSESLFLKLRIAVDVILNHYRQEAAVIERSQLFFWEENKPISHS